MFSTIIKTFKKYLPQTIFGRFLLIIILPMLFMQIFATYIFYDRHWSSVSRHMATSLAGDIAMIAQTIWNKPIEEKERAINMINRTMYLNASFNAHQTLIQTINENNNRFDQLESELNNRIAHAYNIYTTNNGSEITVSIQLADGVLDVTFSKKRIANPSTYIFIMWSATAATILAIIAILFTRNQAKSISKLSKAAEQFGRGIDNEEFKPTGALEIRKAGQAFLDMKERIKRQVAQRTEMLAGVSHDLKTPLTRIKLQLAMLKQSKGTKELSYDIAEMEKMIQGYLDFAKGQEKEKITNINLTDLLRTLASKYRDRHHNIEIKIPYGIILPMSYHAFKRALNNIIENSLRYAHNLKISAEKTDNKVNIYFDDDGPGIPEKKRALVFKPFYRLDRSRNMETGGIGLGLAITRDIITSHAGEIKLDTSHEGGLRVIISIPT